MRRRSAYGGMIAHAVRPARRPEKPGNILGGDKPMNDTNKEPYETHRR